MLNFSRNVKKIIYNVHKKILINFYYQNIEIPIGQECEVLLANKEPSNITTYINDFSATCETDMVLKFKNFIQSYCNNFSIVGGYQYFFSSGSPG